MGEWEDGRMGEWEDEKKILSFYDYSCLFNFFTKKFD